MRFSPIDDCPDIPPAVVALHRHRPLLEYIGVVSVVVQLRMLPRGLLLQHEQHWSNPEDDLDVFR